MGVSAAIYWQLPHGGYCPNGPKAEDGSIPSKYHLNEMASPKYLLSTKGNVFDLDATITFTFGPPTGGSLKTIAYAHHLEKPYHEVDLSRTPSKKTLIEIMCWLAGDEELNNYDEYVTFPPPLECVLNVAGSRESQAPGIQEAVYQLMVDLLIAVNSFKAKHFIRLGKGKRISR